MSTSVSNVAFHGANLTLVSIENKPYVAIKPICTGIGLAWNAQFEKISRDAVLSSVVRITRMTGSDGKNYEMICLPLGFLNGWLLGVNANRVKPCIRNKLIRYQLECYNVLYRHFMPRIAKRRAAPSIPSVEEMQRRLGYPVEECAISAPSYPVPSTPSPVALKTPPKVSTPPALPTVSARPVPSTPSASPVVLSVVSPDALKGSGRLLIRYDVRGEVSAKVVPDTACIIDLSREDSVKSVVREMPQRMYPVVLEELAKYYREAGRGRERPKLSK